MDISTLRKSRVTDFSALTEKLESKSNQSSNSKDERFWSLEQDKAGNGSAVIRFLPNIEGDEFNAPWVTVYNFGFQGPTGRWYIENSLKTIGKEDPVLQLNNSLWASKIPANIEIAKKQKQRTQYISNILVVSDPKHPENEGKVFLFKYGKSIFDKLMGKLKPTFEDDEPVNPFDLWEGCNFKFRMRKKDGYANYDDSTFSDVCSVGTDDKIVEVMKQRYNIQEFLYPTNFKSYDVLKTKLDAVLSNDGFTNRTAEEIMEDVPSFPSPSFQSTPAPTPRVVVSSVDEDEDEDTLAYFSRLANED
jgi:hypothetical protein